MQKTLRINLLARNQVVKRAKKHQARKTYDEWKQYKNTDVGQEKVHRSYLQDERAHRREDWKLGPLAPNRDAGKQKGKLGAIDINLSFNPELPTEVRQMPKEHGYSVINTMEDNPEYPQFKGRTIVGNVIAGDRVVVVRGPARIRGQIGIVSQIESKNEELKINNINVNDVAKPSIMMPEPSEYDPDPIRYVSQEGWIPMANVRLVVSDMESGKEYIVSQVHADGPYHQRVFGKNTPSHSRYITGSEKWSEDGEPVEIPWPEEESVGDFRSTTADTGQREVEEISWTPSMYRSPLGYEINCATDASDPKNAYLAGFETGSSGSTSLLESLGLAGFSKTNKADERQQRIAKGIMDELRSKKTRSNTSHDDVEWVQRKMLEDARSIWWKDRKILPPGELKMQLDAKQAEEARTHRAIAATDAKLIQSTQEVTLQSVYRKPDRKFKKKLTKVLQPRPKEVDATEERVVA